MLLVFAFVNNVNANNVLNGALCVQQLVYSFASKAKIISIIPKKYGLYASSVPMLPTIVGSFAELSGFLDTQTTTEALTSAV